MSVKRIYFYFLAFIEYYICSLVWYYGYWLHTNDTFYGIVTVLGAEIHILLTVTLYLLLIINKIEPFLANIKTIFIKLLFVWYGYLDLVSELETTVIMFRV